MATLLAPSAFLRMLQCPRCGGDLAESPGVVHCAKCSAAYVISEEGVLEFVDLRALDQATAAELRGNTYDYSPERVAQIMEAERLAGWGSYYARKRRRSIEQLARYLERVSTRQVFLLGVGSGREIAYLLHFLPLETVYCSDLSASVLRMVPERLKETDLRIGLFTSDLQSCPVAATGVPVIVVAALHHTAAMHQTLEQLLSRGYQNLFLAEPISNALTRALARWGWAQRVEYSGMKPGRLDLKTLRRLCQEYGYEPSITTMWTFPDDYFARLQSRLGVSQRLFFVLIDALSTASNWFHGGNGAVVHLQKTVL